MFVRACFVIVLLHVVFLFQGCASNNKEEIVKLQRQIDDLGSELQRISNETEKKMAELSDEKESLTREMDKLREENRSISDKNQVLEKQIAMPQPQKDEAQVPVSQESERDMRELKVKVMTGDGNINSAKTMAKKLGKLGYNIKIIDFAPRSNFRRNTIYFSAESIDEAKRLGQSLGRNPILKPLNWSSIYDLIVVTGKKP